MNLALRLIASSSALAASLMAPAALAQTCPAPGQTVIIDAFDGDSVGVGAGYAAPLGRPSESFTIPDCGFTSVFVEARWDLAADDVDLFLLDAGGTAVADSSSVQAFQAPGIEGSELIVLTNPAAGDYTAELRGWTSTGASGYTITVVGKMPGGDTPVDNSADPGADDVVVVAVIDSGINPYHWDYLASKMPQALDANPHNDLPLDTDPATWLKGHPGADAFASYTALNLTLEESDGTQSSSALHAADSGEWAKVRYSTGTLNEQVNMYWVPGTKIIGHVAFNGALVGDPATRAIIGESTGAIDTWAYDSHGIGTSTVAVGNIHGSCPECVLVYVHGTSEAANQWVAKQDWIDLQSNSWGLSLTGAARDRIYAGSDTELQRRATERGQPHFFSAGNGLENAFVTPNPTLFSSQEGPDWIVTVGAINEDGSSPGHGRPSDISSIGGGYPSGNGTEGTDGAVIDDSVNASSSFGGTSNATPVVAGIYAKALHDIRRALPGASRIQEAGVIAKGNLACGTENADCALADGELTVHELLEALYRGASYTDVGHNVGGLATIPGTGNLAELQYMAMGHGAYFGKMLGFDQYLVEIAKITAIATGHMVLTPSAEDMDWYVADSICRQAIWGEWDFGYGSGAAAPGPNPEWPVRSFLASGCPETLPAVVEVEKLYASQFRDLDGSANDRDDDGVANGSDNCPDDRNADQADADGDGIGDACDEPVGTDSDGDGINDDVDNCPAVSNADQTNTDKDFVGGDAQGDACDNDDDADGVDDGADAFPLDPTESADSDSDSVGDNADNCPNTANSDQANLDGDAFGDVCDSDIDGDGIDNSEDACPHDASNSCVSDEQIKAVLTSDTTGGAYDLVVNFDASGSSYADDSPVQGARYTFVFGDGTDPVVQDTATVSHTYTAAGTYKAYVVVTDDNGEYGISETITIRTTVSVDVGNPQPTVAALKADVTSGSAPLQVTFDGSDSVAAQDTSIVEWVFKFGDGNSRTVTTASAAAAVVYTYTTPGTFRPSLTVTDSAGGTDTTEAAAVKVADASGNVPEEVAPARSGGGSLGWLVLLPLMGAALRRRRLH